MQNLSKRQIQKLVDAIRQSDSSGFFLVLDGDGGIRIAQGELAKAGLPEADTLLGRDFKDVLPSQNGDDRLYGAFLEALNGKTVSCRYPTRAQDLAWQLHPIRMDSERCIVAIAAPLGGDSEIEGIWDDDSPDRRQAELPSRREFTEHLENLIRKGSSSEWSVLRIHLTGLRPINRSYGQDTGDEVLRQVASRLQSVLAEEDRLGTGSSSEFLALVLTDGPAAIRKLVETIEALFEEPFQVKDDQFILQPQVGIALYPRDARTAGELIRRATVGMERARHADIPHAFFDEEWEQSLAVSGWLPAALKTALEQNQFELHYQPLIDSQDEGCHWLETLIRWRHPERGMISPGHFIPLAEEMRLMRSLDLWVLENACRDARSLGMPVSVNLSPATLTAPDFLVALDRRVEASGIPANWLTLEITERTFADPHTTLPLLEAVRERDVLIAVDDFGVGYSSLAYLWQFPVDEIKLDGAFIRAVTGSTANERAGEVIRGLVPLARELGIKLVAEGVETAEQAAWLREAGVGYQQGFYHCRPAPVSKISDWLNTRNPSPA